MTPICITIERTQEKQSVPCGKCPACLARRISGWSFRLLLETKICSSSQFITLTYDTINLPFSEYGNPNLNKRDLQLFYKRLRKFNPSTRIKYYSCGEYGGRTARPHYHIILFNANIETIQKAWHLGQVHYGECTPASIGYTLKYMAKPRTQTEDRQPEFSLMSKGLGKSYLTSEMKSYHHADMLNRMYINLTDNKKIAMPRYYKNKIYTDAQRSEISGYQKGEIEKKTIKILQTCENFAKDNNASIKASFKKMYLTAVNTRTKI